MTVEEIIDKLGLTLCAGHKGVDREINGGHCGDLLSEVMANAPIGCVWLTIQVHQNIVAVAVLREMAAIILAGGQAPDAGTIERANEEGIPLLSGPQSSFELAGRLYTGGIGVPRT